MPISLTLVPATPQVIYPSATTYPSATLFVYLALILTPVS